MCSLWSVLLRPQPSSLAAALSRGERLYNGQSRFKHIVQEWDRSICIISYLHLYESRIVVVTGYPFESRDLYARIHQKTLQVCREGTRARDRLMARDPEVVLTEECKPSVTIFIHLKTTASCQEEIFLITFIYY